LRHPATRNGWPLWEDALKFAAGLIAEHGSQAVTVAARERDALTFELGEEEAANVWQRVVDAIIELRFDPAAEAAMLIANNNSNLDLAAQNAARRRDEAAAEGETAIAKRWQRVIVQVAKMRGNSVRKKRGPCRTATPRSNRKARI
jgi:hypothetical protein